MTPDEEVKLAGESGRGAKAEALLNDSLFKEAFDLVEQDTMTKWKTCPVRDQEGQLVLRLKMQVLDEVKRLIRDVAITGRLANEQLNRERGLAERAKAAVREFRRA